MRDAILSLEGNGLLSETDARFKLKELENKINFEKERFVEERHSHAISFHEATEKNPKQYYYTRLNNGKVKRATKKELIDYLYNYYTDGSTSERPIRYSIDNLFEIALKTRKETKGDKFSDNTVLRHRKTFKSYIQGNFNNIDIRDITPLQLKQICDDITQKKINSEKEVDNFLSTIRLIFDDNHKNQILSFSATSLLDRNELKSKVRNKSLVLAIDKNSVSIENKQLINKVFSRENVELIKKEALSRWRTREYDITALKVLFHIYTGCRKAESPAILVTDVDKENFVINITKQQIENEGKKGNERWSIVNYTKDEKKKYKGGRQVPILPELEDLLNELEEKKKALNIESPFLFCNQDGTFTNSGSYRSYLFDLCSKLGLFITNNHAFRKAFNIYLEENGLIAAERAVIQGHSEKVNLDNYSKPADGVAARFARMLREEPEQVKIS